MNDNTIIRIRVPKHLYESVKRELTLLEGKQNLGAGMTPVKEKKSAGDAPKKSIAPKKANAPQKATGTVLDKETEKMGAGVSEKKLHKDGHKKMGLEELKALAEMLKGHIAEMEGEDKKKEKVEEKEEEHGEKKKVEEKKLTKEYNRYDRDEPEEYNPRDYELGYARSGGRSYSRKDVERMKSGLYSDDEIAAAQQADAVRAGRISAPKQTPNREY